MTACACWPGNLYPTAVIVTDDLGCLLVSNSYKFGFSKQVLVQPRLQRKIKVMVFQAAVRLCPYDWVSRPA